MPIHLFKKNNLDSEQRLTHENIYFSIFLTYKDLKFSIGLTFGIGEYIMTH